MTKVGTGAAGFDFTKIANNGSTLPPSATLGSGATDWACSRDNVTGLIWEVKTASSGDLRYFGHTYTWYSSDDATNGGNRGSTGSNTCNATLPSSRCNTEALVLALRSARVCGFADWRVPTYRELLTIAHLGAASPVIDANYFPNTQAAYTWSASSYIPSPDAAWALSFFNGWAESRSKNGFALPVRLVRGEPF